MMPEWVTSQAEECYRTLAAAKLETSDENVVKWLAMNAPVFQYAGEEDLDNKIECFVAEVHKIERGAAVTAEAAQ